MFDGISARPENLRSFAGGELFHIGDVADTPAWIAAAQAFIERSIARRVVDAVALEWPVEEQPAPGDQMTARAGEQPFRHRPRCDVDDVGAEHRRETRWQAELVQPPVRRAGVEPDRRLHVVQLLVLAPGFDAAQMTVAEVGRPPCDRRQSAGERHGVLAGAAADLQDIAGAALKEARQRWRDGIVVAVERRRIEPAIGVGWRQSVLAVFKREARRLFGHHATTASQPPSCAITWPVR